MCTRPNTADQINFTTDNKYFAYGLDFTNSTGLEAPLLCYSSVDLVNWFVISADAAVHMSGQKRTDSTFDLGNSMVWYLRLLEVVPMFFSTPQPSNTCFGQI